MYFKPVIIKNKTIMKTKFVTQTLAIAMLLFFNFLQGQTTVSGVVTDQETNEPIPGVNVVIQGTSEGTVSDFDGNFVLKTSMAAPFTLEISSVGFGTKTAEVTSSDQTITVSLSSGENLEEIIISASRRPQKVQDAPASVSIISAKDIKNSADAVDPTRSLVNIPGVTIQQQSANTLNIEMRAGSGVFGTSTFPILDYRYLVTPSAGTFLSYQTGLSNIDIAKVEVVRGAASALYGPGVTSGVVHFMSKNPIDYPGTTVELLAGTLSTLGANLRHAYANESKTLGFKINAKIAQGDDFQVDPNDTEFILGQRTSIFQPALSGGKVDPTQPGSLLLGLEDLDDNGDGNPLATKYKNMSLNAHLELRPNDQTSAFLAMGVAKGGGLFFNSQGAGYADGTDWWTQARVQSGGLFAQVTYNYNDGGGESNPTFLYASGFRQVAKRASLEGQLQYNFDVPSFMNTNFTIGADYRDIMSDSEGTLYGRNDPNDAYKIAGAYIQGTTPLTEQLELTYAGRYDRMNFIEDGIFAPRVALVYKASPKHTFRASYNIASYAPSALQQNIDFPVSVLAPGVFDVWLSGQANNQNFSSNPVIDITIPGVPDLPYGTPGLPNAVAYGATAGAVLPQVYAGVGALAPTLLPAVQAFFASGGAGGTAYVPGGVTGQFNGYNLFNNQPMNSLVGTGKAKIGTVTSWEIGYSGIIADKLKVGLDVYTYENKGFTQFTAIGPTFSLTGADVAGDLSSTVRGDILPYLEGVITNAVTQQVAAGYVGVTDAIATSLGIPTQAQALAGALAQNLPGATAIANAVGAGFAAGGQVFDAQASALYPYIGTVETDQVPQGDNVAHIPAGYRQYDDATRSHWGADLSLEYFVNDKMSVWGNGSYISQNVWIPGESDDDGLPFSSFLNSPQVKYRAGIKYAEEQGLRFSVSFQHDDEFESDQGVFAGTVQEKNLVDTNLGYDFGNGLELDLSATNLFDQKYVAFPSMPVIGRRVILKATVSF